MLLSKSKRIELAFTVFVFLTVISTGYLYRSGHQFFDSYNLLQLGMTQDDVRKLFWQTPDFDCRFKSSQIWYYGRKYSFSSNPDDLEIERGAMVQSLDEIPWIYGHVQLAFDSTGRLHAYTWNGEFSTVESISGSVKGTDISILSPSDF
jgi:hypothetical protein